MAFNPFLAQITIFTGNFPPRGWAFCNGQILSISQNTALFSLLGTTYGGNGTSNFALPNLQASVPIGAGQGPGLTDRVLGETGGEPTNTLLNTEMPMHSHTPGCSTASGAGSPASAVWGAEGRGRPPAYSTAAPNAPMYPLALAQAGGNQAHNNVQPYQGFNFIIALQGIYPARN